jgi:hypothetical protein
VVLCLKSVTSQQHACNDIPRKCCCSSIDKSRNQFPLIAKQISKKLPVPLGWGRDLSMMFSEAFDGNKQPKGFTYTNFWCWASHTNAASVFSVPKVYRIVRPWQFLLLLCSQSCMIVLSMVMFGADDEIKLRILYLVREVATSTSIDLLYRCDLL